MDELTKRNMLALSQGLKEQRAKTNDLTIQVGKLEGMVGQLNQQLIAMQQQNSALLATRIGNIGSTTKG